MEVVIAQKKQSKIFRVESFILRNDAVQVLMPGDYVELQNDNLRRYKGEVSIEPPIDSPYQGKWPPRFISRVIEGCVCIPNLTGEAIKISKSQHVAQVRSIFIPTPERDIPSLPDKGMSKSPQVNFSGSVRVDPDSQLWVSQRTLFNDLLQVYACVFSPHLGTHNDKSGRIRAHVNIGQVEPPARKAPILQSK